MGLMGRSIEVHERLTELACAGAGEEQIARALHDLTGYPVALEDASGNLLAWTGPSRPSSSPPDPPGRREQTLRRALSVHRAIQDGSRLIVVVQPLEHVIVVLALSDPGRTSGEIERMALEHAGTVLALELVRRESRAEAEARVRRDLVDDLLAGAAESAVSRARTLGYDLERSHRVIVVEALEPTDDNEALLHAVGRVARDLGVGSLLVARAPSVVVLARTEVPWDRVLAAIQDQVGGHLCRIGVGAPVPGPSDFPRSHAQARLALKRQGLGAGATVFEDLGVDQILSQLPESFVRRWLEPLLNYDTCRGTQLTATLSRYLASGGNYDTAAEALSVHRSTVKYRLKRIREVSGHDVADPETLFNLQLATRAWTTLQLVRED